MSDLVPGRPGTAVGRTPAEVAWDAFVAGSEPGSYLQASGWARVKAVNGWTTLRVRADGPDGEVGAQVLVRRAAPLPWSFGYAARGPVLARWSPASIAAITEALRAAARAARSGELVPGSGAAPVPRSRIAAIRIDPEIERDGPLDRDGALRAALRAEGWRPAPAVQPPVTRVIDLTRSEEALWGDLRGKWRQYVNGARKTGVRIVEAGPERLDDFYRVYRETADRAGFIIRAPSAYRDVWDAFAPSGDARLLLAEGPSGEVQAALFLVSCGPRVVEPYGGMTAAGAETRANYLLKWEAIRSSRERGATSYDLWGLAHPGIAHFKTGFGGRQVVYVGAWDLVLDPLGHGLYERAQAARVWLARRRAGLAGSGTEAQDALVAGAAEEGHDAADEAPR